VSRLTNAEESDCVCQSVCVCELERESVCVREGERKRGRKSVTLIESVRELCECDIV